MGYTLMYRAFSDTIDYTIDYRYITAQYTTIFYTVQLVGKISAGLRTQEKQPYPTLMGDLWM